MAVAEPIREAIFLREHSEERIGVTLIRLSSRSFSPIECFLDGFGHDTIRDKMKIFHSRSRTEVLVRTVAFSAIALFLAAFGFAPGATAQQAKKLFFEGDLVRHPIENQAGPFCVLTSQFKRGEAVAWRIRVLDAAGDVADDKVLKSLVVELGDGQKLPAHYGPHGKPPTDYFWSLHWNIPAEFPTGSLGYKVIATMMDGTTQTWQPFTRAPSQLTVIAGEPQMKN